MNLGVGWLWYFGCILLENIFGRKWVEEIEDDYIDVFEKEYGRMFRGNLCKNWKIR